MKTAKNVPALWQDGATMKITCAPNGPYVLSKGKLALRREDGTAFDASGGGALCRCGGSANKPFCDGTHSRNGFSDRNESQGRNERRVAYAGKAITIFDNRSICAHAGICTDRLKSVFRMNAEPWIDPDAGSVEAIIATVEQCPSGALAYARDGIEAPPPARAPAITIANDGPYAVSGSIELDAAFGDGASKEHYTLCRCGGSKRKPFCDGTHWDIGFKDP
jgi:CDGSH-type Zn-finger protein